MTDARLPDSVAGWLALHQASHPVAMDFTLERLRRVLVRLGCAQAPCPVFTVGGTNGKGSVTALLDAVLRQAGHRVALFTSPHLLTYHERIRIDGVQASDGALLEAFAAVWQACGEDTLTYFEHSLAAAAWLFSRAGVDAWVLEVGLGGRLDAVNVFDADVAAVVSVALDHEAILGPTVAHIAAEKAGIFRAGRPAICGATPAEAGLVARAAAAGAVPWVAGEGFSGTLSAGGQAWSFRCAAGIDRAAVEWPDLPLPALAGDHQVGNAAVALAMLLNGPPAVRPSRAAVEAGLRGVRLSGRFERWHLEGREWIVDVAHNPAAAQVLAAALRARPVARTHWLLGILADKDAPGILAALRTAGAALDGIAVTLPGERGRSGGALAAAAAGGLVAMDEIEPACAALQAAARPGERIVACGSFFVVAPVLAWLARRAAILAP